MTSPTEEITALARRWGVDIDIDAPSTPADWQYLFGVEELKPVFEQRMENDEGYDDDGGNRDAITGSAERLEITLKRRRDGSGAYNTTQEYLRLKARAANSLDGEVHIRWYDLDGGPEAYDARALVTWLPNGGNGAARDTVAVVLRVQGKAVVITNPTLDPDPIVTALIPATGIDDGGNQVVIKGKNFTGVTGVSFGANPATSYVAVPGSEDTRIVAVAPAGTAGTVQVTVTTPEGTSSTSGTGNDYVYTA